MSAIRRITLQLCALVAIEGLLYWRYGDEQARWHWFTHLYVGASLALLLMACYVRSRGRVPSLAILYPVVGHLYAMFPDVLFSAGIAHQHWMDIFLGHISTHFVPARNLTWYGIFAASLAVFLYAASRVPRMHVPLVRQPQQQASLTGYPGHHPLEKSAPHAPIWVTLRSMIVHRSLYFARSWRGQSRLSSRIRAMADFRIG